MGVVPILAPPHPHLSRPPAKIFATGRVWSDALRDRAPARRVASAASRGNVSHPSGRMLTCAVTETS